MPESYKNEFLRLAIENDVLRFGEFTLKSGRVSPYFFNAGLFATGKAMALLGQYYAQTIIDSGIRFEMLFGPAYKGIPLAAVTAAALYEKHGLDIPWAYNRKEKKDHGEGGQLVGAPMQGKVLIIDDVITAGTAIREAVDMIKQVGAELAGVVVALDRQEKGQGKLSAVQEVERCYGIRVANIVGLDDLMHFMPQNPHLSGHVEQMQTYRDAYAVNG